jgi:hypothetical protein
MSICLLDGTLPLEKAKDVGLARACVIWRRACASGMHTLEDAEQLELVVHIDLFLLQVNRTCAVSV